MYEQLRVSLHTGMTRFMRPGLLFLYFLSAAGLVAQDYRAKLTVRVTDPSGLPVKGAQLEFKNNATGSILAGQTNGGGTFTFLFVEPGSYGLHTTAKGFQVAEANNIGLQAYQASSVDVKLSVESTTQNVTVTAESALLDTQSASRAESISGTLVTDLPVPNHNPVMLAQNLPGVYIRPLGAFTDPWTVTSQFQVNGGLMYLNEFQIDGAPNDAQFANNVYGYAPPNEAVAATSVNANSYDAQYGRTSGGVIDLSTKSGTNEFHGEGWAYFKRTGWNANSFQNNAIGAPRAPGPQNQWGLQVGGPAYLPKLMTKTSKVRGFYLFSYDNYNEQLPNQLNLSYPEQEMRQGNFSKLNNGAGQPIAIFDPSSGHYDASGNFVRTQFANNIIPANRINPVAAAVSNLMPLPNYTTPNARYGTLNYQDPTNAFDWNFFNVLVRGDFNIGDKYRLFVRPVHSLFTEGSSYNAVNGPGASGGLFSRMNYGILADFVADLNATTVVNVRLSATLYRERWQTPQNQGYDLTKLGLPASLESQLEQPSTFGQWNFQNYTSLGWFTSLNNTETYSLEGSLNKSLGKHNLRTGIDARLTHYQNYAPGYPFTVNNNSDLTRAVWNDSSSEAYSGDGYASFLLGTPSSGSANINPATFYSSWYLAPWLQDDWKVSSRLTINMGLRYDLNLPPTERYDRMNIGFNQSVANPISQQLPGSVIAQDPNLANLKGGVEFAGVDGNRRAATLNDYNNIQPRIGAAFQATPRLVLRGGYGLFYTNFQSNDMMQTLGFSSATNIITSLNGGQTPIPNVLNNPFPTGVLQPAGSSQGLLTYIGQGFNYWNPMYKLPRAHEFSAGFQYRVLSNGVIDVAYVGNRVRAYAANANMNLPDYSYAKQCDETAGGRTSICNALVSNPFNGVPAFAGTGLGNSATYTAFNASRPHPQFGDITQEGLNIGHVWYDGVQISYTQRVTHGLTLNTSYVRSKQIEQWGWMNQYLNIPQRSPYLFNHPNVYKISAVYDLPFGRNRTFNLGGNRILDLFFGGWQVAPTLIAQNGEPANLPGNAVRLKNSDVKNINWNQYQVRGWGNCILNEDQNGTVAPLAYSLAAGCGTNAANYDWLVYQTLPGQQVSPTNSGQLNMKPEIDTDLALGKTFRLWEKLTLDFRAQATNVLNHFNFLTTRFNTNPNDPNFGTVFPAATPSLDTTPRVLQLGVKVLW